MTGKNDRKPAPYQFHHAYSVRFFQPKDSPLRTEVQDLWKRREEQSVVDLLGPFADKGGLSNNRLGFHASVMRWKCSLLTDEARQEHQDWIDQKAQEKEDEVKKPWKAMQDTGEDELSTENKFIQGYAGFSPLFEYVVS